MALVLVTTALGNVGQEVVSGCLGAGLTVRAAHRERAPLLLRFPGVEAVRLDFLDRSTWAPALDGVARVFLVRPPPVGDMDATLNPFITAAYAAGVQQIVFLSVAGADTRRWVPHHKVEQHLLRSGRAYTLLRPGFFAQNLGEAYRRDIIEESRLYLPAGQGRVAFIDARDIAAVATQALAQPAEFAGQALLLTGPEAITLTEAAATLTAALGRTIRYQPASIVGYGWHLRTRRGLAWMQIAVQTVLHVGLRSGDAATVDPTLERLLGRKPRTLGDYVRDSAGLWSQADWAQQKRLRALS